MINYVIVDDEPAAIEVLLFHLDKIPFMALAASFRDPLEALEYLNKHSVDLVFLDINMPDLSGFSLPRLLQNPPLVVFTTAYSEYALKSYELKAIDYLLKPIEFERLLQAVIKVQNVLNYNEKSLKLSTEALQDNSEQTVFIKSGSEFHQLPLRTILYIESDGNYVTFYTTKRSILARYKISEVSELLPSNYFVRIHRSFIVSVKHIETIKNYCVVIDGKEIPISNNYRNELSFLINKTGNDAGS